MTSGGGAQPFGARLQSAVRERGPLCAGIDPHPALLRSWGLDDDVPGLERFALTAAEALAESCAAVKPQSAFFERHGSRGIEVLERTIAAVRERGAQVILDVKRGDIGSTAQGYADAYLDQSSPLAADAVTVSPYLGFGSLAPFVATAEANHAGVFVLALTSNPEAPAFQHARTFDGRTVAGTVLAELAALNGRRPVSESWGSFGAVVGATIEPTDEELDIDGPLLVPGVGAQGGTLERVREIFGSAVGKVIPSSSREILRAGPEARSLADAARRANDEFRGLASS